MKVLIEINSPSECPYRNDDYNDECRYPKKYSMECESKYNFPKGCPLVDLFNKQNDIKTETIYYCVVVYGGGDNEYVLYGIGTSRNDALNNSKTKIDRFDETHDYAIEGNIEVFECSKEVFEYVKLHGANVAFQVIDNVMQMCDDMRTYV